MIGVPRERERKTLKAKREGYGDMNHHYTLKTLAPGSSPSTAGLKGDDQIEQQPLVLTRSTACDIPLNGHCRLGMLDRRRNEWLQEPH